jgi:hypothetical protein
MARYIGHLCCNGMLGKTGVEILAEGEGVACQVAVHQLGVGGERQAMPDDVPGDDGALHCLTLRFIGLLKVALDQPGAGGPRQALRSTPVSQAGGHCHRVGDEVGEVPLYRL